MLFFAGQQMLQVEGKPYELIIKRILADVLNAKHATGMSDCSSLPSIFCLSPSGVLKIIKYCIKHQSFGELIPGTYGLFNLTPPPPCKRLA